MSAGPRGEFVRFAVVNAANTALYWGLYLALLLVAPYMVANVASLVVAVVVAYWLNARYAFRVRMSVKALAGFLAGQGVTILLRIALVWAMVEAFGVDERLAPPIAVALALPVAFVLARTVMAERPAPAAPLGEPALVR
ncbi:GtrA family protein [Blastococcus sp. SYSU DS0617]